MNFLSHKYIIMVLLIYLAISLIVSASEANSLAIVKPLPPPIMDSPRAPSTDLLMTGDNADRELYANEYAYFSAQRGTRTGMPLGGNQSHWNKLIRNYEQHWV